MKKTLALLILTVLLPGVVLGATLPCSVCAGVRVDDPAHIAAAIAGGTRLGDDDALFISWTVPLDGTADPAPAAEIRAAGAKPWIRAEFRTPQPIADHLDRLEKELESIARLVRDAGGNLVVQAVWHPESGGTLESEDHAFLLKKAAVAVTGASADALFVAGPLAADPEGLRALYAEEMAAYLEACLEEAGGDAAFVAKAIGDIARAKGMTQVARDTGLSRESLYRALSGECSPSFDTILKVIEALGLELHAARVRS